MRNVLVPLAQRKSSPDAVGPMNFARVTYLRKLNQHNLMPIFVSQAMSMQTVDRKFAKAHGMLMMGGRDIASNRYSNSKPHQENKPSPERDGFELSLFQRVEAQRIPVLGICRGCQVMAVAAGGSLHQHLPDHDLKETHGESVDGEQYDHVVNITHNVHIKPETTLETIVEKREIEVTSGHHQAVKDPGRKLVVAGESPSGVIEAIEHEDDYFCIGLQSHPETQVDGPFEPVFSAFASALQ
ncbi:MAG: peptidase C26 [Parcubacteria group bacterium SW_6_46_9]|nr:MAG: peptidase C26 [Parcubacteria group bacterium SW_6_46_9]